MKYFFGLLFLYSDEMIKYFTDNLLSIKPLDEIINIFTEYVLETVYTTGI